MGSGTGGEPTYFCDQCGARYYAPGVCVNGHPTAELKSIAEAVAAEQATTPPSATTAPAAALTVGVDMADAKPFVAAPFAGTPASEAAPVAAPPADGPPPQLAVPSLPATDEPAGAEGVVGLLTELAAQLNRVHELLDRARRHAAG